MCFAQHQAICPHNERIQLILFRIGSRTFSTPYIGSNLFAVLPPEITQLSNLEGINLANNQLTVLPSEIGQLHQLRVINLWFNQLTTLPREICQLANLETLILEGNSLITLPSEIGQLDKLSGLLVYSPQLTFPPPEIHKQGPLTMLAYLRDDHAMLIRQTIAAVASGIGGIALVILAFRWRQRRELHEKKKRL